MKLTVKKPFSYAGRKYKTGETLSVPAKRAKLLVAVGKARFSPPKAEASNPVETSNDDPNETQESEATKEKPRKRTYKRRDMAAEPTED